jgi:hypothetical protein
MNLIELKYNVNRVVFRQAPWTLTFFATDLGGNIAEVENILPFAPPCTLGDHVEFDPETHEITRVIKRVRQPRAAIAKKNLEGEQIIAVKKHFRSHDCPAEFFLCGDCYLFFIAIPATMEDEQFLSLVARAPAELTPFIWDLLARES